MADQVGQHVNRESMRDHDRLGAAVAACGKQFERYRGPDAREIGRLLLRMLLQRPILAFPRSKTHNVFVPNMQRSQCLECVRSKLTRC
jgi:hypothetical protein